MFLERQVLLLSLCLMVLTSERSGRQTSNLCVSTRRRTLQVPGPRTCPTVLLGTGILSECQVYRHHHSFHGRFIVPTHPSNSPIFTVYDRTPVQKVRDRWNLLFLSGPSGDKTGVLSSKALHVQERKCSQDQLGTGVQVFPSRIHETGRGRQSGKKSHGGERFCSGLKGKDPPRVSVHHLYTVRKSPTLTFSVPGVTLVFGCVDL